MSGHVSEPSSTDSDLPDAPGRGQSELLERHSGRSFAGALARRMKQLREPRMRQVVMAEYLRSAPPRAVIRTLHELIRRVDDAVDAGFAVALDSLMDALGDERLVAYESRARLYAAAKRDGRLIVARLFFGASPGSADEMSELQAQRPLRPRGRPLSLGERKSLARSPRRQVVRAIARDPHPDVVRIALGNPHITETDVVQMAARRPTSPTALAAIVEAPKWRVRYPVKRALVKNPYTPVHLAMRLLITLRASDLSAIAEDAQLSPAVRSQARALIVQRR